MDSNYNMSLVYFSGFEYEVLWFSGSEVLVIGQRMNGQKYQDCFIMLACFLVTDVNLMQIFLNRMRFTKRETQSRLHVQALVCEDFLAKVVLDNTLGICFSSESRFFFSAEIAF